MHGSVDSPHLPVFGNKVLAVSSGVLDIHGVNRTRVRTWLKETVLPGAIKVTLAEEVDWQPGDQVAIAATSFDGREGESRTIVEVDVENEGTLENPIYRTVLTFDRPLDYKHFAMDEKFGADHIDMRAEIGLLTRNVRFRGLPVTS